LFWDASAESLGIGTSSPAARLDVNIDGNTGRFSRSGTQYIEVSASSGGQSILSTSGTNKALTIGTTDSNQVRLQTNGSNALTIDASQNVGIGTSAPSAPLTVSGNTTQIRLENTASGGRNWALRTFGSALGIYDHTAGAFRQYIDSAGNVGIGTNSPFSTLHIKTSVDNSVSQGLVVERSANTDRGYINYQGGAFQFRSTVGDAIVFGDTSNEQMRLTSTGLGIGTSSPASGLHLVNNGLSSQLRISNTTADSTTKYGSVLGSHYSNLEEPIVGMLLTSSSSATGGAVSIGGGISSANAVNTIKFYTAANNTTLSGSEAMRIDSAGNLLVGKTSAAIGTEGVQLESAGSIAATRSGGNTARFNRLASDGDVVQFQKDGTTVGSIGTLSGTAYILGSSKGLRLGSVGLIPATTAGANSDATYDLGDPAVRFKSLYLSGGVISNGVYLGGTGAANLLDDYEEGTWTPTGSGVTLGSPAGTYTKVGRLVTVNWLFVYPSTTSGDASTITGLPFSVGTGYTNGGNQGYVSNSAAASIAHITAVTTSLLYRTANGGVTLTHADLSSATIRGSMTYMTA
jgi:hypothetical protein